MKKLPKLAQSSKAILFHVRPYEPGPKDRSTHLMAFASHDQRIADIVRSLFEQKRGVMVDNQSILREIARIATYNIENFDSLFLSDDLNLLNETLLEKLSNNADENICYHIIITGESYLERCNNGKKKLDSSLVAKEIAQTLVMCTTFFLSYYLDLHEASSLLKEGDALPVVVQEELSKQAIARAKQFAIQEEFEKAAELLCYALDQISDRECYKKTSHAAAGTLAGCGEMLGKRAKRLNNGLCAEILKNASKCYITAMFYYDQLRDEKQVNVCRVELVGIRHELLKCCAEDESVNHLRHLLREAALAVAYYRSIGDAKQCDKLRTIFTENPGMSTNGINAQSQINFFSNKKPGGKIDQQHLPGIAMWTNKGKSHAAILVDAKRFLKKFQQRPADVLTQDLISCQLSLEKVINCSTGKDGKLKNNCYYALGKVHYSLAIRATDMEMMNYHLFKISLCLRRAAIDPDPMRVTATIYHMLGKVLIEKNETDLALRYLRQAYALYKAFDMHKHMDLLIQLSPDLASEDGESFRCAKLP
jgi:tetratricopeptide (TPR) repeat protein